MRDLTARAEPIVNSEAMRLAWFKFPFGRAVVTVDQVSVLARSDGTIDGSTMELQLTIRTRKGSTIAIEKIDVIELAQAWAQSIMDD